MHPSDTSVEMHPCEHAFASPVSASHHRPFQLRIGVLKHFEGVLKLFKSVLKLFESVLKIFEAITTVGTYEFYHVCPEENDLGNQGKRNRFKRTVIDFRAKEKSTP